MTSFSTVNSLFKDRITKLESNLVPCDFDGDIILLRNLQDKVSEIIDKLGKDSTRAQGLGKVLTTTAKLRSSDDIIYLLKDEAGNNNNGEMIGLLKMGRKKLYLNDSNEKLHILEPLCVLDFYVNGNKQRSGLGKELFDYMLRDLGAVPAHLAIDGPSAAMTRFLEKKYGIRNLKRQANNFAVCPEIFTASEHINKSACSTPGSSVSGAGRYTAARPRTDIGQVIHGSSPEVRANESAPQRAVEARAPPSPVETEAGSAGGDWPAPERPSSLPVAPAAAAEPAERLDSHLTDKGFFDVKFYHNKLW